MLTEQDADLSLSGLLNALPDGIAWVKPVYDEQQTPINFRYIYVNDVIRQVFPETNAALKPGDLVLTTSELRPSYIGQSFAVMAQVLQTGVPQVQIQSDEVLGGWYEIRCSCLDGGVLIVVRESNEHTTRQLQSVIDHSQTGIFVFSPVFDEAGNHVDFRFRTVNRMVAALVGQTPGAIRGSVASDWFISYRETGLFDRYQHTYLTGEPQRFDIHYNVDGFDRWFYVQSIRVDSNVLVTFTDYTLLKQAQHALEEQASENQQQSDLLNGVLDGSESGILAFEAIRNPAQANAIVDFRFIVANKVCETLLNLPLDAILGKNLYDVFPGNWETGLFDLYVHTTETGQPSRTEIYYKHDGLDFWLNITAHQLGDGFVVTFTDISALKRANQSIEEAANELITVIDTSQTGIFLFTPVFDDRRTLIDFRFRVANRQLAAYVGQQPETIIGGLGSRWFPHYMTNGLFDLYSEAYLTGRTQRFDFHYNGDGIDVWLDILATKMGDAVLVTFTDYTALKKLQQQLENSVADLKRSNQSLEQFAFVSSHDLQEPLRKIQSFGDILQTGFADQLGEEGSSLISRMQLSANRMSSLIRDLLTYSRLTPRQETAKSVSLQQVLEHVLDDLDLSIRETGAVIEAGELPTVNGYELQLRQLIQNLLTNAIKFRPDTGHPVIHIERTRIAEAELPNLVHPLRKSAHYECLTVRDNGIGFDEKYAERIFRVFQRLHGRGQYEGTGIGLAIVQKVVDNHGGAITAISQPGQGATFTIYLPV